MIPDYSHLLGKEFDEGRQNCYSTIRAFYDVVFGIELRDYANPHRWWDMGGNLFMENFQKEGFQLLNCPARDYQFGDVIIMGINAPVGNHSAVIVENNKILHHLVGQRSCVTHYGGLFRNTTLAVLRRPDVIVPMGTLDFSSLFPVYVARQSQELETPEQSSSPEAGPRT